MTQESRQLIAEILSGSFDEDLGALKNAIVERRKMRSERKAKVILLSIQPGEIVRFNSSARPQYLRGLRAEVVKINRTRAAVRVVEDDRRRARRFGHGIINCPATLIEQIEAA